MNDIDLKSQVMVELFEAITAIESMEECQNFLRDLCTLSELKAMAERLQVAKYIKEGLPYREISKKTGASTATITRVAQWLKNGMGGYEIILKRVES